MSDEVKKSDKQFNAVKVFSATMAHDRDALGDKVTAWIAQQSARPDFELVDTVITQSSDEAFHCIAITVFYVDPRPAAERAADMPAPRPSNGAGARRLSFKEDR